VSDEEKTTEQFVREESREGDRRPEVDPHDDRTQEFSHLGLSRMRLDWKEGDAQAMAGLHQMIENVILEHFGSAYQIMNDIYEIVREPKVDPVTAEIETDEQGWTVWERNESGAFIEDYSRLGSKEVKDFLFKITTRLFQWEQDAARLWGDSMFAKAVWEQALAQGYQDSRSNGARTVEDRTQAARVVARDDRLFALFLSVVSRRADAVTRSMNLLSQRLKDVLQA
jgi:hypothetical protein